MEATGGYESLLVKLLHEHQIALAVVNPTIPSNTKTHASKNPNSLSTHWTKFEFENLFLNLPSTLFKTVANPLSFL